MIRGAQSRPVFSIWAWLVLSPYLLVALGGVDGATTARQWLLGATASIVVHLVLLAAFLAVGAIEVRIASRPALRWTVVGVALLGIAFGRPALISTLQHALGVDLIPPGYALARVVLNALVIGIGAVLTYILLDVLRRNLEGRRRMLVVLARVEAHADEIDEAAQRLAAHFQQEVRRPVLDALGALVPRKLSNPELATELQWVAHSVVRPLSHKVTESELEDDLPDAETDAATDAPARADERGLLRPTKIIPAQPWLTTLIAMTLLMPPELNVQGPWLGLGLIAIGALVSLGGSLLIRVIPLPASTPLALMVLTLEHLAVAGLVVWVLLGPAAIEPIIIYYLVYAALGYAIVGVILAIIRSAFRELASQQETIATALQAAERRAFAARERLATLRIETGRLLHTAIQGDLVATYLQLKLGTAGEDVLDRLIERVDHLLEAPADSGGSGSAIAIRDGIHASLQAWSLSLELEADVDPAALDRIAALPRAASIAHDTITEGLTNAVRHSRSERATVRIGLVTGSDDVEVVVTSPGRITPSDRGMGLRDLDARARDVSLTQVGEDVVLRALV